MVPSHTVKRVVTKVAQPKIYSDYKWPYVDSYVPNVKMLEKDAQLIKASLAQEHFTSPLSDKHFGLTDLEKRNLTLKMIEKKFKDSMNDPNLNHSSKKVVTTTV